MIDHADFWCMHLQHFADLFTAQFTSLVGLLKLIFFVEQIFVLSCIGFFFFRIDGKRTIRPSA